MTGSLTALRIGGFCFALVEFPPRPYSVSIFSPYSLSYLIDGISLILRVPSEVVSFSVIADAQTSLCHLPRQAMRCI